LRISIVLDPTRRDPCRGIRNRVAMLRVYPALVGAAVRLQALPLSSAEQTLGRLVATDQLAPQTLAGRAALPESQPNGAALTREHLDRKFTAVFRSHGTLQGLERR
jgi:hypothetical protein